MIKVEMKFLISCFAILISLVSAKETRAQVNAIAPQSSSSDAISAWYQVEASNTGDDCVCVPTLGNQSPNVNLHLKLVSVADTGMGGAFIDLSDWKNSPSKDKPFLAGQQSGALRFPFSDLIEAGFRYTSFGAGIPREAKRSLKPLGVDVQVNLMTLKGLGSNGVIKLVFKGSGISPTAIARDLYRIGGVWRFK
jgi:hypothetical protein